MLHFFCSLRSVQLHSSSFLCSRAEQDIAQHIRDGTYWGNCSFSLLFAGRKQLVPEVCTGRQLGKAGRGLQARARICWKGKKSKAVPSRMQNLHSVGIWEQMVAAEILQVSRGTGSSRLASVILVVPPELSTSWRTGQAEITAAPWELSAFLMTVCGEIPSLMLFT